MKKFTSILLAIFCCAAAYADTDEMEEKMLQDCKKINYYAQTGLDLYKKKQYIQARKQFLSQVTWSEVCGLDKSKIVTAYNNVALSYLRQNARNKKEKASNLLKAFAWLNLAPNDSKSQYNLKSNRAAIKKLQNTNYRKPVGTYWQYVGQSMWNEIIISKTGEGKYRLEFEGLYVRPNTPYYGPNMGELSVDIKIKNHQASFTGYDCQYVLTFTNEGIHIERISGGGFSCGFGYNVFMDGDYVRVN